MKNEKNPPYINIAFCIISVRFSSASSQTSNWYVSVPYNPGRYQFNISWTDYYRNTYNITGTTITIADLSLNVSSLEQNSTAVNSRLNNVQSNVTSLQSNSTAVNTRVNSLQSNTSSLNSNIQALNSTLQAHDQNSTFLDISANPRPTASGNIEFKIFIYDINGLFVNATDLNITVYDANKNKNTGPVDYDSQLSQGIYQYNLTAPSTPEGLWEIEVNATRNGNMFSDRQYFLVVGGPFDVRTITVLDGTINDLSVSVLLENTGNVRQDMVVNWNLTRTDTGALLDSGQDTVAVNGGEIKTHTVTPNTNFIGEVKITFLGFYGNGFGEKAGAQKTFTTIAPSPSTGSLNPGSASNPYRSPYTQKPQPIIPIQPSLEEKEFEEEKKKLEEEFEDKKKLEAEKELQSNIEIPLQTQPPLTTMAITPIITPIQLSFPSMTSIFYSVMIFMTVLVVLIILLVRFAGLKTSFKFEIGYNNQEANYNSYKQVKKNNIFRETFTDKINKTVATVKTIVKPKQEFYRSKPAKLVAKQKITPANFKQYFPQTYSEIEKQKLNYPNYQRPVQQEVKERVVTIKKEKPVFPKSNNSIIEQLKKLHEKEF